MANSSQKLALVTGASSGIGLAFAERLVQDGFNLVIVARRRDRLEQFSSRYPGKVELLVADLASAAGLQRVEQHILSLEKLDLLINNAGFGGYKAFMDLEPEIADQLIFLKVNAVTRLTRAALKGMLSRGAGVIINVSSRLAFTASMGAPLPKRAVYVAANAYINAFTRSLHTELQGSGVKVQALCPGVVETEFHERVGIPPGAYPAAIVMQPGELVAASLKGLEVGEVVCMPALADSHLLDQIEADEKELFEKSRIGTVADRYR